MMTKEQGFGVSRTTAIFAMVILLLQIIGTVGNWIKPVVVNEARLQTLESNKDKLEVMAKENQLAHAVIKEDLDKMGIKLENIVGKMEILISDRPKQTMGDGKISYTKGQ